MDAGEQLEKIENIVVHLERELTKEELDELFRAFHTLKGNASIVGLENVRDVSHAVEDMIGDVINKGVSIRQMTVDLMLVSVDAIQRMLRKIKEPDDKTVNASALIEKIGEFRQESVAPRPEASPETPNGGVQDSTTEMRVKTLENLAILEIPGLFEMEHSGDLIAHLKDLLKRGTSRFIFDFRDTEKISEGGVSALLKAKKEIEEGGGVMASCRAGPDVQKGLSKAGGIASMNMRPSLKEALDSVEKF